MQTKSSAYSGGTVMASHHLPPIRPTSSRHSLMLKTQHPFISRGTGYTSILLTTMTNLRYRQHRALKTPERQYARQTIIPAKTCEAEPLAALERTGGGISGCQEGYDEPPNRNSTRHVMAWHVQTKNPQGLETLRIAPASSPSPFPQPTKER